MKKARRCRPVGFFVGEENYLSENYRIVPALHGHQRLQGIGEISRRLFEQVDRLSRLDDAGWKKLKELISSKSLSIISLDLPTSYAALEHYRGDDFTSAMLKAINAMMLDMLAAIARKDYQDR